MPVQSPFNDQIISQIREAQAGPLRSKIISDTLSDWLSGLKTSHPNPFKGKLVYEGMEIKKINEHPMFVFQTEDEVCMNKTTCPSCGYILTTEQTQAAFTSDPFCTKVICPQCANRYQPAIESQDGEIYLFLCRMQTLMAIVTVAAINYKHKVIPTRISEYPHIEHGLFTNFENVPGDAHQGLMDMLKEAVPKVGEKLDPFDKNWFPRVAQGERHFSKKVITQKELDKILGI